MSLPLCGSFAAYDADVCASFVLGISLHSQEDFAKHKAGETDARMDFFMPPASLAQAKGWTIICKAEMPENWARQTTARQLGRRAVVIRTDYPWEAKGAGEEN